MLKNFKTYQLAVTFYRQATQISAPSHLKDQLLRASSSIALNLAEGSAKGPSKDQQRFFRIAMGSLRECQAILELLLADKDHVARSTADSLGAALYRLITARRTA